ncbi:hypothetical protein KY309_03170 [Candidatus Woesearchaeota archaeon]|nr:hypothetical protein [Candidatus Woesearchaeota archaeon]
MKNKPVWPLLLVALLALGTFSIIGMQDDATGDVPRTLARPVQIGDRTVKPPVIVQPGKTVEVTPRETVYVVDSDSLTWHDCILAKEIALMKSPQEYEGDSDLYKLILACAEKGWN